MKTKAILTIIMLFAAITLTAQVKEVTIGTQTWMAENLVPTTGSMIKNNVAATNNGIVEYYCYNNDPAMCAKYGSLWQWDELMQYVKTEKAQGICPTGWHIPTKAEWQTLYDFAKLEGLADLPVNDNVDMSSAAGVNLRSVEGWEHPITHAKPYPGKDLYGFTALAAGYAMKSYAGLCQGNTGRFWTSTMPTAYPVAATFYFTVPYASFANVYKDGVYGARYSVRCIKD